ncbi:MAG: efflux RND transporter periplasmic adaptor subunit [Oscillospiraceae bacterium]
MSKKSKIVLGIVIAAVVVVVAVIAVAVLALSQQEKAPFVNNTVLSKGEVSNSISATGKVESNSTSYVHSSATYEIEEVNVEVGDKVNVGDILCTIDDSSIKTQIAIAESNLKSASMSTYNNLQTAERRYKELLAVAEGNDNASSTQVSITNAKNNLDNAQKAYDKAKEQYEDMRKNANYASAKATADSAYDALRTAASDYNDALEKVGLVPVYDVEGNYIGQTYGGEYSRGKIAYYEQLVAESREYVYNDPDNERLQKYYEDNYDKLIDALPDAATRAARNQFNAAQTNYDNAKRNLDEIAKNLKDAFENAETALETAKLAYDAARNDVTSGLDDAKAAYELALKQAENEPSVLQLNELKKTLDECTVKAEKAGTVTAVYAKSGNIASGTLFIIEDTDDIKITASVKQYDVVSIKEGQKVTIRSDALEGEEYNGVISLVAPAATKDSPDGSFLIEADVTDKNTKLLIGLKAKLNIIIEEATDVFTVRYDGIGSDDNGDFVYVAEKNETGGYTAKKVYVELGLEGLVEAEVKSSELKEGDIIILDVDKCTDGGIIKLKPNKNNKTTVTDGE